MKGVFENTFANGMSSDYDVVLQPEGTYRYMRGCQLVSQDGHNFVVKDAIGNTLTFTINAPYDAVYTVVGDFPKILAMISFPNKIVVFSTNSALEAGGYMEIGILSYLPYGEGIQPTPSATDYNVGYIPLYHSVNLHGSQWHKIKGFSFIENELIERVYWTDNYNEPRVFNVSDPIFTTYFATGTLAIGDQYMVLEGAITHNAVNYGPGLTAGNVFTAANANYTALTSPAPKVIQYYPYQLLDFTPSRTLGNIIFDEYGGGSLICGSKVYYYRLGSASGAVTSWSYGSSPVPVGTLNETAALTAVPYQNFVGGGTEDILLQSQLSVIMTIENIDTNFDYIEMACAEFDQLIDEPRQITIVARETITGSTMNLEHTGNTNLGVLTIGDITLLPASILKVKTLATNKNYMLAGNITEREEFELDFPNISAAQLNYPMPVHYDADSCSLSGMVPSGLALGPASGVNPGAGEVYPNTKWRVVSGTITYNGNSYGAGEFITGVTGAGNDSFGGGGQVRPVVTKNRYTTTSAVKVENFIELKGTNPSNTCFWDYKSAAVASHVRGYWSGEMYRFGILFYDLKGNPYYVKWLADLTFPRAFSAAKGGLTRVDEIGNTGVNVYSVNPSGVSLSGIEIPPSIIDQISGFSIVRAERNARIIAQGLVTQCVHTGATPDVIRPAAFIPPADSLLTEAEKCYSFICPDILVGVPLKKEIGAVGDLMEQATWVEAYDYNPYVIRGQGVAASEQVYSKYLECKNDGTGNARSGTITYFGTVNDSDSLTNLGNGDSFQNGNLQTSAGGCNVVGDCVTGGLDYSLASFEATGGKKSFFKLQEDFLNYGPSADGYTDPASGAGTDKIIMNYVKAGFTGGYGAKENTLYISTGHFQPITAQVKTDVFDGTNYTFNDVEIFGGDCYTNLIDYGYALWDNTFTNTYSYAWTFPCECNSNYDLRRGRKTSNSEMYYTGAVGLPNAIVFIGPSAEVRLEQYSYNQGYSTEGQRVRYPALPANFINSNEFEARIRFAGQKFSGEIIDSFRTFKLLDFKDLSYNYGRINDINVKEDKVIVWQDIAISTVPILERQVISSTSGDETAIGTGGVVDRFDVISSFFGTQHQWSICETEYGFAFFDMRRKAFVILSFNGGLLEASQVYGLKGFFDEAFLEIEGSTSAIASLLVNSPTFADSSDRPLLGVGIISVFDPKFKMTYMTFKFFGQISSTTKCKDFTIGYLHTNTKKCFVGFFDWFPYHLHNHNGIVLSATDPKNRDRYLGASLAGAFFFVGETIWGADANKQNQYICIADVTLDNAVKFPEGASGATYWTLVNTVRQVFVLNQPTALNATTAPDYNYNKFDNIVTDNEIHIIVNPPVAENESLEVQNMVQSTPTNVNYTSVYVDAEGITASDVNISATSLFYRFIRNKIYSSAPLPTPGVTNGGRITNAYARIRFIKKNWSTNPTVLTKAVKILRSLSTVFNTKK